MSEAGINLAASLSGDIFKDDVKKVAIRQGFGEGLLEAGKLHQQVVGLCADLTESTRMNLFAEAFPARFFEAGVAEQNLVTVASGMAAMGKIPFVSSYAAFSPGRNYEQIRTTICLNDVNVKIVGSHAGVSVGPDGATHQMLEDMALMRALPNMRVIAPCDAVEATKATLQIASHRGPSYIRLGREPSPVITTKDTPFGLGKAQVFRHGSDLTIVACGQLVYQALLAADDLSHHSIQAEVINCPVIKPLDVTTIITSARKTGAVISLEEHQINGGLGSAVAEALSEHHPTKLVRMGIPDRFGESGTPDELLEHFGLTAPKIVKVAQGLLK